MREHRVNLSNGHLYFKVEDKIAIVTSVRCESGSFEIPDTVEDDNKTSYKITKLGKKSLLGTRNMGEVIVPESVTYIDDWAFAHCAHLKNVIIGGKPGFGKGVFTDCKNLENLKFAGCEDMSVLLAAAPCRLNAEYLLKDVEDSSNWTDKWEQALITFLSERDDEGYTDLVLCGEEDIQRSLSEYCSDKRKAKSMLCFLRLMNDKYLTEDRKEQFVNYLLNHNIGTKEPEAWLSLMDDLNDSLDYYRLFAEIGGINKENIDQMIDEMNENHAEAKAWLIAYNQDNFNNQDAFSEFDL